MISEKKRKTIEESGRRLGAAAQATGL